MAKRKTTVSYDSNEESDIVSKVSSISNPESKEAKRKKVTSINHFIMPKKFE